MYRLVVLITALIVLFGCQDQPEPEAPRYNIKGSAVDEFGGGLDSVTCILTKGNGDIATMTDPDGKFLFSKVQQGNYQIRFSKAGYITGVKDVDVNQEPTLVELVLSSGTSFLRTSDSLLYVKHLSESKEIRIESNTSWTVTSNVPWIKAANLDGNGNSALQLTWEKSDEDADRVGIIRIRAGSLERTIKITQSAPVKLVSYSGAIGNHEIGIEDSIKITFNRPITVNSIETTYHFCYPEFNYKVNGKNLSIAYKCAFLGETYPFKISVKDGTETFYFQLDVKFYDKKVTFSGEPLDYFITDDNEFIWAITRSPNKVVQINIKTLAVVKERALDFTPSYIRWNAFKKKINIFKSPDVCSFEQIAANECDNNLIYLDPNTLEISRSRIKLISGYDADSFNYPYVFPNNVCLFEDGTGVIQLRNTHNYNAWRFIDSQEKDTTYISGSGGTPPHNSEYQEIFTNHDKTKIYLMYPNGQTAIDIFDFGASSFKTYQTNVGRSNLLLVNKKTNLVFHGQLYEQFVTDLGNYKSKVSLLDTRWFYGGVDFSYKAGEEETIYYLADGTLRILDYKRGFTSFSCDTYGTLQKIQSTTDGVYLVAIKPGSTGSTTDLYVFDIDKLTTDRAIPPGAGGRLNAVKISTSNSVWSGN